MSSYRFAQLIFTFEDGGLRHERAASGIGLRPQAARLLRYLLEHAGEVVPREQLYSAVWGDEAVVDFESGLAALMRELRQAIRSVDGPEDLIETVPRRGYRLNARVHRDGTRGRAGWLVAVILAAMLPVAIGTGYGVWLAMGGAAQEQASDYSLAILPFENYERSADIPEHVGLLMADTLLAELLKRPVEGLELIGRTSLRPYLDREDVVAAVAAKLDVELLIEGSVVGHAEDGWQAELRLLSVPAGRVIWSTTARGEAGTRLEVRSVTGSMAGELVRAWPDVRDRLHRGAPAG